MALPIHDMHVRHPGLTEAIAASYLEAARVCLSRHHVSPVTFTLANNGGEAEHSTIEWEPLDARTVGAWGNSTDATEAGGYCCAIAGIEESRKLLAVRRAETGTGADYYVGPAGSGQEDLEDCWRLEISGSDGGDSATVGRRLVEKIRQARSGRSSLPAIAAVVGFKQRLILSQDVPELH